MNFAIPSGHSSGELPGAYTSRISLSVHSASFRSCASVSVAAVKGVPIGACASHFEPGGLTYTTAWCTFARLDGRISDVCTHSSRLNPVGTISYVYSTSPRAGISTGFVIVTTSSGCGIIHPSAHWRGGGASFGFPSGAPALTHAVSVAICSGVSEESSANFPTLGSANHGGISLALVFFCIAAAYRYVSLYVTSGIGAISPARWHFWQRSWRMGSTSL